MYGTAASKARLGKGRTRHGLHRLDKSTTPKWRWAGDSQKQVTVRTPATALQIQVRLPTSALPSQVHQRNTLHALSPSQHIHSEPRNTLCIHFPDIQNGTAPVEGSQASPACPYDNSITYLKTSMEQGGMTERGWGGVHGKKLVPVPLCSPQTHWDRSQTSSVRGRRPCV